MNRSKKYFNLIEDTTDHLTPKLPRFAKLYMGNLTVKEIQKQLNITINEYRKLRNIAAKQNLIKLRKSGRPKNKKRSRKPRNIYPDYSRRYYPVRNKGEYYCCCKSMKEAEIMRDYLRGNNWSREGLKEKQFRVRGELYYG